MKKLLLAICLLMFASSAFADPTVHSSTLAWTQSTSSGITANCVYRSAVNNTSYSQIFCSTAPITSYVDLTVVGGTQYFYKVTAKAGTQESGYSNEVSGTVPLSPAAPTGLNDVVQ